MSADALDAMIVRLWRERVAPEDVVWHLGDIGKAWTRLRDLPGQKHLVLTHASDRKAAIRHSGLFASISDRAELQHRGTSYLLIHDPDGLPEDSSQPVIHGHHHYRAPAPGRRSVCVDHLGWGPVAIDALLVGDR